jgi:hypothetical protein
MKKAVSQTLVLFLLALVLVSLVATGQTKSPGALPFSSEQNFDGARFVWFVLNKAGLPRPYEPCAAIPNSKYYRKVTDPRAGDLAWWPTFVALYDPTKAPTNDLLVAGARLSKAELEHKLGPAIFYRAQVLEGK